MTDIVTPNMGLTLPTPVQTPGPTWAVELNEALTDLDQHSHQPGSGVPITEDALAIGGDLSLNDHRVTNASALRLLPKTVPQTGSIQEIGELQNVNGDLYFVDSLQRVIQLTALGEINVSANGYFFAKVVSSYPYFVVAGDKNAVLLIDTSFNRSIMLPAASAFDGGFGIKDVSGQADVHKITVVPNGSDTIDGLNSSLIMDAASGQVRLISDHSGGWSMW